MELTELATGGGTAFDFDEVGVTLKATLISIGDWRPITGRFGTVDKSPFNLLIGEEERTLWVKKNSRLATVLGAAFKEAGLTTITCGGELKVRRVDDVPTDKGNPMHDFVAKYTPPTSTSGPELDDF